MLRSRNGKPRHSRFSRGANPQCHAPAEFDQHWVWHAGRTNIKALKATNNYCAKFNKGMVPTKSAESGVWVLSTVEQVGVQVLGRVRPGVHQRRH